jgi:hypothetical protein
MRFTFATRSVPAAVATPAVRQRRANGSIAISAAFLVTSSLVGGVLLFDHPEHLEVRPHLRQSLLPPEFSCSPATCAQTSAPKADENLHSP